MSCCSARESSRWTIGNRSGLRNCRRPRERGRCLRIAWNRGDPYFTPFLVPRTKSYAYLSLLFGANVAFTKGRLARRLVLSRVEPALLRRRFQTASPGIFRTCMGGLAGASAALEC